jgi:hypothetical protein
LPVGFVCVVCAGRLIFRGAKIRRGRSCQWMELAQARILPAYELGR